ncbi:MAG: CapA family protein, partial [Anaerolineales bacterium]
WAIVPFEALEPRWKVLAVDGQSPIRKDFEPQEYPLSLPLTVTGEGLLPGLVQQDYGAGSETPLAAGSNRQDDRLTTVALTGVTALVRATAFTMEQRGVNYPAQDIGGLLKQADILHISNEVPFAKDCPFPDPVQPDLKFCSAAKYIELLETIGTDVVELTGDHFADWGREAMDYTLKLYADRDWPVYGGGETLQEGKKPITLEHNGNKLAFIGCNAKGGGFAQASSSNPGAVPCDYDFMHQQIRKLTEDGYNVIVTFQHFEYYTYAAQPNQIADARGMAEAGAAIVSGSQAHQPQGMEFDENAFIHHGLGNLFFDQYEISQATRQGFIDRHVFYGGRYISTELIPIMFVDFARPRLMNADETADVLNSVFSASGW